ncbi:MAG: response regulator [Colwellia sp.]|uniref:response regulator n=1 Tax=Colwellia sp. TaxID=56799 RepID=UPI001D6D5336|nr:response regulator [Colwellia sp.]NQY49282.1 response regulator [Colwellia sp.]
MHNNSTEKSGFQFTIKKKLFLNAFINISLILIIGLYALNQMKLIGEEVEEIAEIDMPLIRSITAIEAHQLEQAIYLERLLRLGTQTFQSALTVQGYAMAKAKFLSYGEQVKQELILVESKVNNDIEITPYEADKQEFQYVLKQIINISAEHKSYQKHAIKIIGLLNAKLKGLAFKDSARQGNIESNPEGNTTATSTEQYLAEDITKLQQGNLLAELEQLIHDIELEEDEIDHELEQLLQEIEDFTQNSLYAAEAHEKAAIKQIILLIIIGTILAALGSFIIARLISLPITRLKELAKKVATGDLSQQVSQISNDELGDLSLSINSTIQSIAEAAQQAEAIASGDFSQEIHPKSEQDKLGHALHNMKSQIIAQKTSLAEKVLLNEAVVNASLAEEVALNLAVVNTSLDAILTIDELGTILSCNSSTMRLFHYRREEIIGKNIKMLMPMPYTSEHDSYLTNYKTSGIKKIIGSGREVKALKKDGSIFPIALSVGEVAKQGARDKIYTGFIRDISQEKKFEADLQQNNSELSKQNERQHQLAEINELTQGTTDLTKLSDDIITCLANSCHAGHGVIYMKEQQDNNSLSLVGSYAFRSRKNIAANINVGEGLVGQCAKEKKVILLTKVPGDYIQINSALGEQTPLNLILLPVLFETKLMAVIELASFHEFTEEQQLTLTQVAQNLGIVINNLFNQQRTKTLLHETQQQAEELQTQQEELKSANENLVEQTEQLKASEEELRQQSEELQVSNEELGQRQKDLQAQRDKIAASEQELAIKAKELTIASKYKSEFLANMSHELRTPLNSLLLLAKGLADNVSGHLDETEVEDAHIIYDGGQSLLHLINDILDLSKVEAGKLNVHLEKVQLGHIKEKLLQLFNPLAKDRNIQLSASIAPKAPVHIISDSLRLEQILRNLLSNAIKFTEMGEVKINFTLPAENTHFRHKHLTVTNSLAITVSDTGVGIAEDKLQAIFEAFQQEDGSTSRKYGGTGLGLTIARELSHLLGGEIQLTSQLNKGSSFTLFLPLSSDEVASSASKSETEAIAASLESKNSAASILPQQAVANSPAAHQANTSELASINREIDLELNIFIDDDRFNIVADDKILLVIDDDKIFAKILRDYTRKSGYKCLVAGDGRSGIYLAQHHQPNGIILDLMLPDIDGHQVLEQLKSSLKTQHIPVEIISAHSENRSEALAGGAIGLQTKPVSSEQLHQVLIDIENLSTAKIRQVLIIEDNQHHSKATSRLLENIGLKATCVSTGAEGCAAILTGKYDCVILDLGLPDMSGIELLKQVNTGNLEVLPPVIVYTGKEISDQEQAELDKYSSTVVIKGTGSPERLLDDISLFLHGIEEKFTKLASAQDKNAMRLLHDEDAMLQGRKILLTDDDMRNTYALSKKLIDIGCDVEMANNGKEAVEILREQNDFELILMDTMMPVMDGNEATQIIRNMNSYKKIPIIALTAKTMPEDRELALKSGASEYLTKPIDFEKLVSILRIWLFKKD